MSVQSPISKVAYAGNNSASTAYPVPFPFLDNEDLRVVVRDAAGVEVLLPLGSGFAATGAGSPNGGNVLTAAAWDSTHTVTIYREVAATQLTSYADNDAFPAASHERALDRLTMLVQQALRLMSRSFKVSEASPSPAELTLAGGAANKVVGYDSAGNATLLGAAALLSMLEISGSITGKPTAVWSDATQRAAKVPDFTGQLGWQLSDLTAWASTGTGAGSWGLIYPADGSITSAKLALNSVTAAKIAANAVGTPAIQDAAITSAKIQDAAVSPAKMSVAARRSFIKVSDTFPSGTHGQDLVPDTWVTRRLNTVDANADNLISPPSSDAITVPAGTYEVLAFVPQSGGSFDNSQARSGRARLYNITSFNTLLLSGSFGNTTKDSSDFVITISGSFTVNSNTTIRVEHLAGYSSIAGTPIGGAPNSILNVPEIYTQLMLWKVA